MDGKSRVLRRERMSAPVGTDIEVREIGRKRDLPDIGTVGICCVDALSAVDKHAEDDPRAVGRPMRPEREVLPSSCLERDRREASAIGMDGEQSSTRRLRWSTRGL